MEDVLKERFEDLFSYCIHCGIAVFAGNTDQCMGLYFEKFPEKFRLFEKAFRKADTLKKMDGMYAPEDKMHKTLEEKATEIANLCIQQKIPIFIAFYDKGIKTSKKVDGYLYYYVSPAMLEIPDNCFSYIFGAVMGFDREIYP